MVILDLKLVNFKVVVIDIGLIMYMVVVNFEVSDMLVRLFGMFMQDLYYMVDWFKVCGVISIVMEFMGVYWILVFEILEVCGFEVVFVNV